MKITLLILTAIALDLDGKPDPNRDEWERSDAELPDDSTPDQIRDYAAKNYPGAICVKSLPTGEADKIHMAAQWRRVLGYEQ